MKNSTKFIHFFSAALLMFSALYALSQHKPVQDGHFSQSFNAGNPVISMVNETDPEVIKLEKELDAARSANNADLAGKIQAELDKLRGHNQVYLPPIQSRIYAKHTESGYETDYNLYVIHNFNVASHAFSIAPSISPFAGRMFYLISQSSSNGSDTLRLMYSNNLGVNWLTDFFVGVPGYKFNKDELDMEIVYDGTNTWMFGVAGVTNQADTTRKVTFFRKIIGGPDFYATLLTFPGNSTGMSYYYPRITSDNSNYSTTARIMVACSMDSIVSGSNYIKQKYALCSQPFAAMPSFNFFQPGGQGGFGWWGNYGSIPGCYLYNDIAFYKDDGGTGANRVVSVYGVYHGQNNIYLAYLNEYSTLSGYATLNESNFNKELKIVYNGGVNNRYGMISYVRQTGTGNWDIYGFRTSNGGAAAADWMRDTIEGTPYNSRTCDLVAVRNGVNQFKLAFAMDMPAIPAAIYRAYNGGSWTSSFQFNNLNSSVDTAFGKPKAGYTISGSDDGVGIWSEQGGHNGYLSKQMLTTTGITSNNEIPEGFSLSQNYPNPFNPVTNIKFSIPKAGIVSLAVYDITGREVAKLVNGNLNAGSYTLSFNASNFSSGAYFYRITADGFTDVKKMLLVK